MDIFDKIKKFSQSTWKWEPMPTGGYRAKHDGVTFFCNPAKNASDGPWMVRAQHQDLEGSYVNVAVNLPTAEAAKQWVMQEFIK